MRFTSPPDWDAASRKPAPGAPEPAGHPVRPGTEEPTRRPRIRASRVVSAPAAWWTAPRPSGGRSGGAEGPVSRQETFEDHSRPVAEVVDDATKWLGILLPIYLTVRIFGFAGFQPSIALEIVRQQGVSGIAEAALASLFSEIAGLVVLAGAVLLLRKDTSRQRRWVGALLLVLGAAFAPLPIVVVAVLLVVALWGRSGRVASVLAVALAAVSVAVPATSGAWVPHERVTLPDPDAAAGKDTCYLDGYVLGRSSGTFYSVLQDPGETKETEAASVPACEGAEGARRVHLALEVESRRICATKPTPWDPFVVSAVELVAGDVAPCSESGPRAAPGPASEKKEQLVLRGATFEPEPAPPEVGVGSRCPDRAASRPRQE